MSEPTVSISARGEDRLRTGHLWIYRSDVTHVSATAGDTVLVKGAHGRPLGRALFSDRSQIAIRLLTHDDRPADLSLWRERIDAAVRFRESLAIDATAYRLVNGEGDLLPSFIVDRYGDCLVVQALSQAVDRLLPDLVQILVDRLQPRGVLARNDSRVRALEGLATGVDRLHGEVPERTIVTDAGIEFEVDLFHGQKTGLFLDQRENRAAAAAYAHGRLLDCFSYNGAFALRLARSCREVIAVDVSEEAVERIKSNAARNNIPVDARVANVFDELRALERGREQFDTIVLDPPAFAKNKASVERALAGYKEINLRALKLLAPGGYLVTCSCSYHVDEAMLGQVVYDAAADAHVEISVVEKRMQARDHPILLGVPETYYLKCFLLRRLA
ncbi:MAG: class I SAM-dependent rRNA methyltransferase [Bacteroidales bacterium]